ncbi:Uncharacterized oxidoreductase ybiC [Serratia entomophila]|nr:Uncharacterized oxidoreductase ybiC [Serratia entomophila]CAI1180156.1 Uncharacterized oxidoreductase ybiC [Serratia entomophila]CAI1189819.1 Uncharacterized oxidoreductase ybiC [Serratia entomophila]CAI1901041.1 Uncharacterized oxidoreductase ybiC [Serratia entomophila]CAI1996900.1 Uncharacterized oxidoreductase ybiC [Serratia entomophila]
MRLLSSTHRIVQPIILLNRSVLGSEAIFNCMTTLILNPQAFDAPAMQAEAEAFIDWVKASPPSGGQPIAVPGEWEQANRAARLAQGIPVDANTWRQICAAAQQAGMADAELEGYRAQARQA